MNTAQWYETREGELRTRYRSRVRGEGDSKACREFGDFAVIEEEKQKTRQAHQLAPESVTNRVLTASGAEMMASL